MHYISGIVIFQGIIVISIAIFKRLVVVHFDIFQKQHMYFEKGPSEAMVADYM